MKFYQINQYIRADELRVVDSDSKQVGVLPREEALEMAKAKGLDLVEIAPKAKPPVAKIIDFKKFKYLEAKKEREAKSKSGKVELKEVRFTPFIAQGDFESRMGRIRDFFQNGDRVKVVVKFTGRQITRTDFGRKVLDRIVTELEEEAKPDGEAKLQGKQLYLILNPIKKNK
jgi:translation initiation factor IF-3